MDTAHQLPDKLLAMNEALVLGAVRQHELTEAAERLNQRLREEIDDRKAIEEELRVLNATLEQRVAERNAEAERRASQLQALALEITQTENRERRRLAQVLHDHLQQLLVGAKMRLSFLNAAGCSDADQKHLGVARDALTEAIEASRSLTTELSPAVLFGAGLTAVMQWLGRWMLERHDLVVHVEGDPAAQLGDPDLEAFLFQATRELLFNVVKHAGVKQASIHLSSGGDHIELVVQDQGLGVDPRKAADLPDRPGPGQPVMGFGLLSIRERLVALGGCMKIESAVGHGTRISLVLPVRHPAAKISPAAAVAPPAVAAKPTRTGVIRVLIVDDHKLIRRSLVGLLASQPDIQVVGEAPDGQVALKRAAQLLPHIVLMDVNMPSLGGIEATRLITAQLPAVRVIGLTMHAAPEVAAEMRRAGAMEVLTKDGPSANLLAAIRRCSTVT